MSVPFQARCMPMEILACGVHTSYKFILHTFRKYNTQLKRILSSFPIHGKPTASQMPKTTQTTLLYEPKKVMQKNISQNDVQLAWVQLAPPQLTVSSSVSREASGDQQVLVSWVGSGSMSPRTNSQTSQLKIEAPDQVLDSQFHCTACHSKSIES